MIDADNSGAITFEELKEGLRKVGSELIDSDIKALMEAVHQFLFAFKIQFLVFNHFNGLPTTDE